MEYEEFHIDQYMFDNLVNLYGWLEEMSNQYHIKIMSNDYTSCLVQECNSYYYVVKNAEYKALIRNQNGYHVTIDNTLKNNVVRCYYESC